MNRASTHSLAGPPAAFVPMRLPALARGGQGQAGLSPAQSRAMVAAIVAGHVALGWGLLQVREVREAVLDAAPIFVSLIAPPKPPEITPPPPPPTVAPTPRRAAPPVIAAAPSPAPAAFEVAPAPPQPEAPAPTPVIVAAPAPAPAPSPPAPPPAPKIIPASAVQYLEPITLDYPRLSRKLGEAGKVVIRVYIDEAGLAKNAQVNRSSGHPRLDEVALAAIQKARFKPYMENGQAVPGWAFIPLDFELEK